MELSSFSEFVAGFDFVLLAAPADDKRITAFEKHQNCHHSGYNCKCTPNGLGHFSIQAGLTLPYWTLVYFTRLYLRLLQVTHTAGGLYPDSRPRLTLDIISLFAKHGDAR